MKTYKEFKSKLYENKGFDYKLGHKDALEDHKGNWVEKDRSEKHIRDFLSGNIQASNKYIDGYIDGLKKVKYKFKK